MTIFLLVGSSTPAVAPRTKGTAVRLIFLISGFSMCHMVRMNSCFLVVWSPTGVCRSAGARPNMPGAAIASLAP